MNKKRLRANTNPDAAKYIIVHTKEGDHIRAKRTNPFINDAFKQMAVETCSGAAKQILLKLKPFIEKMVGRMNVRLSGKMRSAKKQSGFYNCSLLNGFELQKDYPLDALYKGNYKVKINNGKIELRVPVTGGCMQQHNGIVTGYYFEAVLLTGNVMVPNSLRVEDDRSALYLFTEKYDTTAVFQFIVSEKTPYLLFLKAACMESLQMAQHAKHYGMRVVLVGL